MLKLATMFLIAMVGWFIILFSTPLFLLSFVSHIGPWMVFFVMMVLGFVIEVVSSTVVQKHGEKWE